MPFQRLSVEGQAGEPTWTEPDKDGEYVYWEDVAQRLMDLRLQATKCKNPRAASILISVASWLEGKPATEGNLDPHQFTDLWTDDPCSGGCRIRKAVSEFMENTTPNY